MPDSNLARQTILVTGATGFLGSYLVKRLLQEGHQLIILKRSFSNTWRIDDVLSQLSFYNIDECELSQPFKDFGYINAVIHTATCYGRNHEKASEIFETNTAFPLRLLEIAISFNTETYFNTGTYFIKATVTPNYLNSYILSKKQFMQWGKQVTLISKIRFVNINLEHLFGPSDDDSKFTTYIIKSCLENKPELKLTAGEQKRDFIYIDDVVTGYSLLLHKSREQPHQYQDYELGNGQAASVREFVETAHRITNSQTKLKFGVLPYRNNEIMHSEAHLEPLLALGWIPTWTLEEGLRQTIAWYSQNEIARSY